MKPGETPRVWEIFSRLRMSIAYLPNRQVDVGETLIEVRNIRGSVSPLGEEDSL
jgi:hypothetical protein